MSTPAQGAPNPALVGADERGGNVYDKYGTTNPIERRLVDGFLNTVEELVALSEASEAHEVGCGEGEVSLVMARNGLSVRGTDAFPGVIEVARNRARDQGLNVSFEAKAVQELDPKRDSAELIACCEVLEHLEEPMEALETLAELAKPWLLVSVPREPLWRGLNMARFAYVRQLGNTPGHVNHWSRQMFTAFLERRVDVVEVRTPVPWTMALCRSRSG